MDRSAIVPTIRSVDALLIERAKAGDAAAMETLLAEVAPSVHRFGSRMCRNATDAEDVVQDTLLAIASHLGDFEGRSSLTSWVFTLARTACSRKRRGLKNQPHLPEDAAPESVDGGASPEEHAERGQLADALRIALGSLPDDYREVLFLRDVEGLTAPEAAESLGITVEALKSRLHRARAALREAMRPVLEPSAPAPGPGCPDVLQLFSRKLEGDLEAIDCAAMEKHILGCPACGSACQALRDVLSACKTTKTAEVPPELQDRVKKAVRAWVARTSL